MKGNFFKGVNYVNKVKFSFTKKLLNLISEPEFVMLENILGEPNFFRIVGRSHYERWHSSFWGWLLDSAGSHLLEDYVLKRFLTLLLDDKCLKPQNHQEDFLLKVFPVSVFSNIEVTPNEYLPVETSISGVGRFDIFLTAKYTNDFGDLGRLNIIFELKVDSKPSFEQSQKYADWLYENHPESTNILIYIKPSLLSTSLATVGDERWYCISYQLLNDKLLVPLVAHPRLNTKVKPFVIQYMKNLKIRHRGVKMAITDEEKKLAVALYEKYGDVFDSIYDVLVEAGMIDYSTADNSLNKGRVSNVPLSVRVGSRVFSNMTIKLLFEDILKYLVKDNFLLKLPLPWGKGKQRYIITNQNPPVHPNSRPFFYPFSFSGYTIETHYSRDRGIKVLADLCEKLEIDFEVID
jgi:hypothetical protein